ncbi:hypothetical protein L1999_24635 [Neobacillus drentensis]|uniref:hypothetical protein n=1 Tax=Neobacillus drentensis TaxID=220684 RepID=UPI001F35A3C0|nr:hypothetical protein [Neobacillus drentensis]ULT56199.1 hypothetical protein L1999_24635 [Neobacillus drentensis]
MREAPTLANIPFMIEDGENVKAMDPVGIENFNRLYPQGITYCYSIGRETIKSLELSFL